MSENILVVEYEPRYTDRVRQALASQPFTMTFAKDGEEAIKALDSEQPRLIVLSSVVPKISTTELIRAIRGRKPLQDTPILLTVSGYTGKTPKADAQRVGASDILPKPYSESEFLGKIQTMLGIAASAGVLTSTEIFGDIVDKPAPVPPTAATPAAPRNPMASKTTGDVDKLLADTLSGVLPQKKTGTMPGTTPRPNVPNAPPPAAPAPPPAAPPAEAKKTTSGGGSFDRLLNDTLSGLEKNARRPSSPTGPGTTPVPPAPSPAAAPAPKPAPAPDAPRFNTEKMQAYVPDRVPVSQPVFAPAPPPPAKVEEDEPVLDGVKFGQYVLIEKIATGGMAEVWKARMRGVEGFQKIVAIKKILPHLSDNQDFIEMFVDEAKLAAQLNHNNIIHIYDLGKIQASYYIAMEYIDGYDLKTILKRAQERDQPMQTELALFIASKVAAALDYAHRKRDFDDRDLGLVHRDVSPQNVLISQEGDIKLCDFGIAKAASKASHTQAGALKGKLQYMSPEQAWGRAIDKRSDVFALAAVLFEMLTGRRLFSGDNELSILEQVREARVIAPSTINDEVTPDIDNIVLKALSKDPAQRYQTAGEMARDIDAILYNFRPTPTSADLAIYMHRLSTSEPVPVAPPEPEHVEPPKPAFIAPPVIAPLAAAAAPIAVAAPAPAPAPSWEATAADGEQRKRGSSPVVLGAIAAVVIAAIGLGGWFMLKGKGTQPSGPAAPTTSASALNAGAPTTTTPAVSATTGSIIPVPGTAAPLTTSIDPNAVDAEVQKRLAAERERLLRQQAATTTAATATVGRPTPVPAPQVAAATPAPVPVQPQPTPVQPQPVTQTVAPAPVQPQPDPEPAAPVVQRAREGDLVPVGTEGLTPPRLVRKGNVTYPPVAKVQRQEGSVICNVLVSETGQVLEVRILRGVRGAGLNEAAEQTMRRSTFQPATKDGVRVKSWISVPVDFKL
jgi:TonB family protein